MNLLRNKINLPIIFNNDIYKDNYLLDINDEIKKCKNNFCCFADIPDYFQSVSSFFKNGFKWEGQHGYLYFLSGVIYFSNWSTSNKQIVEFNMIDIVIIIIKNLSNNQLTAYINKDYIDRIPSHKTLLNKFAKFYGIVHRKDIQIKEKPFFKQFNNDISPTMDDFKEDTQLKMSKQFLTYKKWKIPN